MIRRGLDVLRASFNNKGVWLERLSNRYKETSAIAT